jgi:hypothetical protein
MFYILIVEKLVDYYLAHISTEQIGQSVFILIEKKVCFKIYQIYLTPALPLSYS